MAQAAAFAAAEAEATRRESTPLCGSADPPMDAHSQSDASPDIIEEAPAASVSDLLPPKPIAAPPKTNSIFKTKHKKVEDETVVARDG